MLDNTVNDESYSHRSEEYVEIPHLLKKRKNDIKNRPN